jgi:hypothetical protein
MVAADLWLVEDGGGISLSPGLRYRHRLTRDLDWSVGAGPVWFPETGSFSASFRRAETSVTIGRAVVVGLRAEQVRGSRPLYSTVVGASGEHGGVLTALAVIGLLLLAASSGSS